MVHYAEHRSFKHLCFNKRSLDYDYGLVREGNLALFHCINVSGEAHICQIFPELGVFVSRKELLKERLRLAAHRKHHLDDFFGAAHHSPVVVLGSNPVEQIENGHQILAPAFVEGLSHCVLVLVRTICYV